MTDPSTIGGSGLESTAVPTGAERTLELLETQIGRSLDEVETPVAILDLDRLEANLQRLQSYVDSHAIALWPHTKTHKSPDIGLKQLALGAQGLTVARRAKPRCFMRWVLRESSFITPLWALTNATGSLGWPQRALN